MFHGRGYRVLLKIPVCVRLACGLIWRCERLARTEQFLLCHKPILQIVPVCAAAFEKDLVCPQRDGLVLQFGYAAKHLFQRSFAPIVWKRSI